MHLYVCFSRTKTFILQFVSIKMIFGMFRKNNPLNLPHIFFFVHFHNDSDKSNYGNYLIVQAATSDSCLESFCHFIFIFIHFPKKIVLCCAIIRVLWTSYTLYTFSLDVCLCAVDIVNSIIFKSIQQRHF